MRGILCSGKRLISAPRLVNILTRRIEPLILNDKPAADVYKVALSCIADAPTVDAVEVVRCKDCKHYTHGNQSAHWNEKALACFRKARMTVSQDDFCSKGERREGE